MRRFLLGVGVVSAVVLTACGSGGKGSSGGEVGRPEATTGLAESTYLGQLGAGELRRPTMVATAAGLVFLGGAPEGDGTTIAPVTTGAVVHEDGTVTALEAPPGGALANGAGSAYEDVLYVAAVQCASGTLESDTSALSCDPGTPTLLSLDLDSLAWTTLALPDEASAPAGVLGDQRVYALDGSIVYEVITAVGEEPASEAWTSWDAGASWSPLPTRDPGSLCAIDGTLVNVSVGDAHPGDGIVATTNDPSSAASIGVQRYDADAQTWSANEAAPITAPVVAGSTTTTCIADAGVVASALTGGTGGLVALYTLSDGWSVEAAADGARVMDALPSFGSGILVPQIGTSDLVRIDAEGARHTESISAGSIPIAGIGAATLVKTDAGEYQLS